MKPEDYLYYEKLRSMRDEEFRKRIKTLDVLNRAWIIAAITVFLFSIAEMIRMMK